MRAQHRHRLDPGGTKGRWILLPGTYWINDHRVGSHVTPSLRTGSDCLADGFRLPSLRGRLRPASLARAGVPAGSTITAAAAASSARVHSCDVAPTAGPQPIRA